MSADEPVSSRLASAAPALRRIEMESNAGGGDLEVVRMRDSACKLLTSQGLVDKMRVHSQYIGVHPRNRYGKGIVPQRAHELFDGISTEGWSDKELTEAWASEMQPFGHKRSEYFKEYSMETTQGSAGLLPDYPERCAQVKAVSVTCGHTSQTLRLVWHGSPLAVQGTSMSLVRCCEEGKLSLRKLHDSDPEYACAVENGLVWNIIRWEVEEEFPFIMDLVQEAGNRSQALAQCESREEIMLKLHNVAERLFADDRNWDDVDGTWERVKAEAMRGKPSFVDEVDYLLKFAKSLSGGLGSPTYSLALRNFQRPLKQVATAKGWLYSAPR